MLFGLVAVATVLRTGRTDDHDAVTFLTAAASWRSSMQICVLFFLGFIVGSPYVLITSVVVATLKPTTRLVTTTTDAGQEAHHNTTNTTSLATGAATSPC